MPTVVRKTQRGQGRRHGHDFRHGGGFAFGSFFPFVYVPLGRRYRYDYDYGYGYDDWRGEDREDRIVIAGHTTKTASAASRDVVSEPRPPAEPQTPQPKIYELRPSGQETEPPSGTAPIEILRGGRELSEPGEPDIYLIALRDEMIVTSQRHWIEDDTLHYITAKGVRQQVPMAAVDLGLTARLNRERGLVFTLEVLPESR